MRREFHYQSYLEQTEKAINELTGQFLNSGRTYRATEEIIDADELFKKSQSLYVNNPASLNLPLAAPLYLAVDVAVKPGCDCEACDCPCSPTAVIGVTQTVWDDPAGEIQRRLGTVTQVEGQEPQVQWGPWLEIRGQGGRLPRLTGPTDFYIRKDGDDQTSDGLSPATALATWQGFYNRYLIGPDLFDCNLNELTFNFGPGHWEGAMIVNTENFIRPGRITITGAGLDQTSFSNSDPSGVAVDLHGNNSSNEFRLRNFTIENTLSVGIQLFGALAWVRDVKFKGSPVPGQGYGILAIQGGIFLADSSDGIANLYFDNYKGHSFLRLQHYGRGHLKNINIVLTGVCSWANAFVEARYHSRLWVTSLTYQGTSTGRRYSIYGQSLIHGTNGNANLFPGNQTGDVSAATFCAYL